jgi:hypothetical protein
MMGPLRGRSRPTPPTRRPKAQTWPVALPVWAFSWPPSPPGQLQDDVAIALAPAAACEKLVDKLAVEPNPHLSVSAFAHLNLIDPRYPRLESFVGFLSYRDAKFRSERGGLGRHAHPLY